LAAGYQPEGEKIMKSLFLALMMVLVATPTIAAETSTIDKVFSSRTLKCGTFVFNNLYEPGTDADHPAKGFFVDITNEIAARLKITPTFTEIGSFATGFEELKSGRYDMLCASLASHAANYDKMLFTSPLFYDPIFVYGAAKRDYSAIKSREDINDPKWRIAGMDGELGGIYGPLAFPKATMKMIGQNSAVGGIMTEMFTGKADMVMLTKAAEIAYESTNPDTLKPLISEPIAQYPIRFVFKPEDVRLKLAVDAVIEDMRYDGTLKRIIDKYGFQ
jgi:polar amino acid transport system substrate-binding protein